MLSRAVQIQRSDTPSASQVFGNPTFSLGIAVLFIYVLLAVASLLISDAWPIVTSYIQYLVRILFYINVSDVFAFCNTFIPRNVVADADPVVELPKVETHNGKGKMDILTDEGLDAQYEQQLSIMKQRSIRMRGKMATPLEKAEGPQNASRMFEALLVIIWTSTNFILVYLVLGIADVKRPDSDDLRQILESKGMHYIAGIMWVLAGLTGIKVVGSVFNKVMTMARDFKLRRNDERRGDDYRLMNVT